MKSAPVNLYNHYSTTAEGGNSENKYYTPINKDIDRCRADNYIIGSFESKKKK